MPAAPQILQMLQQHFQRIQRRWRVFAFQVEIQPVEQLTVIQIGDAQRGSGTKLGPVIVRSIINYAYVLQPVLICVKI